MNADLLTRALQFVQVSSSFAKRAGDELNVHHQAQKRAEDLRAPLLTKMLEAGVIPQESKEAADAMLGSHAETMQLLSAAVEKIAELRKANTVKVATDLGAPEGTTSPAASGASSDGVSSLESCFVGGRHGDNVKVASDEALRKILHS